MTLPLDDVPRDAFESQSLGQKMEWMMNRLPPEQVNITEIMDLFGQDSLILLAIFLSLIFLVPVSVPGVSTVFGMGILLIGFSRLLGRKLWLPKRIAQRQLSSDLLRNGMGRALVWFHRLEKISHPGRLSLLTHGRWMAHFHHLALILAALLLMAPFGLVPFSNTLPALAVIFLCVGMLQRDGLAILLGLLTNVATMAYFAVLIVAGGWSIMKLLSS